MLGKKTRGIILAWLLFQTSSAMASSEREFVMSCTYGVLAGTLVGAASLAFVDKPGDNLQRVARGASLGLYAGIALGFYTVYYLPGKLEKQQDNIDDILDTEYQGVRAPNSIEAQYFPIALEDGLGVGVQIRF